MYLALLCLSGFIFVVVCLYYARSPAFSFFHPLTIYLAFHGLVFVFRPMLSWYYGFTAIYDLYEFSPDAYAKNMALIVANVGLVSFAATSLYFGNIAFENKFDALTEREAISLARPLTIVSLLLLPLIAYSTYLLWQARATNMAGYRFDAATGATVNVDGVGYIQGAQALAVALVSIFAWVGRFRPWTLVPAALFVLFRGGSGGRGPIIAMLLCFCCFYLYTKRRKFPDLRVLMMVTAGIMLFNFVGADRGHRIRALFTDDPEAYVWNERPLAPMEGMDAGNLEFLEYLTDKVPRDTGTYEYFLDNLQIFTEPVPRALWKNKPIGSPVRLFSLFDYGYPIGMTRSLPGEGWMQFGLLGVAAWCALWGAILGRIYTAYVNSPQTVLQTSLYFCLLAMLTVFYRDGMLLTLLKQILFYLFPALLWHWLAKIMDVPRRDDFRRMAAAVLARRQRADGPTAGATAKANIASAEAAPALVPRSRRRRALPGS